MRPVAEIVETVYQAARAPARVAMTPPRLYLNGFPKAGLHLADRMAVGMFQPVSTEDNWYGTNAWGTERQKLELAAYAFGAIAPGQYLKGHSGYLRSMSALLRGLGIGMVLVYRDLRDVVVSQTYHILRADQDRLVHQGRDEFLALGSKENIMLAVIEGITEYDGIFKRWETFAPWLDEDWVLPVKFEHMIKRREQVVNRFFDYCYGLALGENGLEDAYIDRDLRQAARDGMLYEMQQTHLSATFRKGKVKQWRQEFTPRVVKCFKDNDPGWLVRLGYEKDDSWR